MNASGPALQGKHTPVATISAAYNSLAPEFERAAHHTVATVRGASMGATPEAIPNRLQRGESADVVIMVGEAIDELVRQGKVVAGSRVDLFSLCAQATARKLTYPIAE